MRARAGAPGAAFLALLALVAPSGEASGAATAPGPEPPAAGAIRFYQRHLSSLRAGRCRFDPSCSEYAIEAIEAYGFLGGAARTADRLVRCNRAGPAFYARGTDGRLLDPARGEPAAPVVSPPAWLRTSEPGPLPPISERVAPEPRARAGEAVEFAERLAARGDRERAATEFLRAASLAATPEAESWAFARIGVVHWSAGDWAAAERSFLVARDLSGVPEERARDAWRAALSRFALGRFAACESLLAEPEIDPAPAAGPAGSGFAATPAQRAALAGLCAMGRGGWTRADAAFAHAESVAGGDEAPPIARMRPFTARGPALPHRSPGLAHALSIAIPGAGQAWCGRGVDGVRHFLVDGALIWTVVTLARDRHAPAAFVAAGFALPFYSGNVIGAGASARAFNRARRLALVREAVRASER